MNKNGNSCATSFEGSCIISLNSVLEKFFRNLVDKDAPSTRNDIEDMAAEMSEQAGITIEPSDIADFIVKYPLGTKERAKSFKEEMSQEQIAKSNKIEDLKKKFTQLTGLEAKQEFLLKALEQSNRKS